jgi:hypothetical protein
MVIWAKVQDRSGVAKPSARPLLVISVHPTNKKAPLVTRCISTREINKPNDPVIEMPWHPKTGAGVGLYKKCFVVLRWSAIVEQADVEDITGTIDRHFLEFVLDRIIQLRGLLP